MDKQKQESAALRIEQMKFATEIMRETKSEIDSNSPNWAENT